VAFIRAHKERGHIYYYLVENRREGKKVHQRTLKYLGTTPPEGWKPRKKAK
jgi:hypothetical protein